MIEFIWSEINFTKYYFHEEIK